MAVIGFCVGSSENTFLPKSPAREVLHPKSGAFGKRFGVGCPTPAPVGYLDRSALATESSHKLDHAVGAAKCSGF